MILQKHVQGKIQRVNQKVSLYQSTQSIRSRGREEDEKEREKKMGDLM